MYNFRFRKSVTTRIIEPVLRPTFTEGEIAVMAGLGSIEHISSGEPLMTEGTDGTHVFFITTGSAAVSRDGNAIAVVGAGDIVGERALVTGEQRNATVTALMPVTALQFDQRQFAWLQLELAKVRGLTRDLAEARG